MKQNWNEVLGRIEQDPRYLENLDWGRPRRGHPEGTVRAHIKELEANLVQLTNGDSVPALAPDEVLRLRILIHVHDSFKADARPGVNIEHPRSHATLAAEFLREMLLAHSGDDPDAHATLSSEGRDLVAMLSGEGRDLIAMVQNHDVPYALWRKASRNGGAVDGTRFQRLLAAIDDWRLFSAFLIVDNCTAGKSREPLRWYLPLLAESRPEIKCWQKLWFAEPMTGEPTTLRPCPQLPSRTRKSAAMASPA